MTANQIAYQRQKEEGRSNLVREAETNRSNLANEAQRRAELAEAQRHNVISEAETQRANQAREQEANRSNLAKELETNRHNLNDEQIRASQVGANLQLGYATLGETSRANQAQEQLKHTIADADRASRERVAAQTNANQFRQTIYKEGQSNKRAQAGLEVETYKTQMQGISGLVNSFVKMVPWLGKTVK